VDKWQLFLQLKNDLILGLDIGSSSVRAALFDHSGKMKARSSAKVESSLVGDAPVIADEVLTNVIAAVDKVFEKSSNAKSEITHIASCAFWHSLVGVDLHGYPTTEVFTWADTRSRECTSDLRSKLDEAKLHNRTGARFHSSFWPAKLLWLKGRNTSGSEVAPDPETAKWLSLSDYIQTQLCGEDSTSTSMASATGLFDQHRIGWDHELLRHVKAKRSQLAQIAPSSFQLTPKFKKRWPRLKNAKWLPSIGDGAASNIGSGCVSKNRASLMIGTSGAMRIAYEGGPPKKLPFGLWCYRIDEKRVIVGGALSDGGGLYALLKNNLNVRHPDKAIGEEMSRRGADAHGLTVMPFFFGERSTGYHEDARGYILGLNSSHDAIDILQAAMEAVAFRFAEIFDQLKKIAEIAEIVLSGGAIDASPVWSQIIADVLGRDLQVLNEPEASLRGAVLLALESLGKIESIESFPVSTSTLKFHPKCHEIYKNARKRHVSAYEKLIAAQI
jgi:gluconokinase